MAIRWASSVDCQPLPRLNHSDEVLRGLEQTRLFSELVAYGGFPLKTVRTALPLESCSPVATPPRAGPFGRPLLGSLLSVALSPGRPVHCTGLKR